MAEGVVELQSVVSGRRHSEYQRAFLGPITDQGYICLGNGKKGIKIREG